MITGYVRRSGEQDATRWEVDGSVTTLAPAAGHTSASVRSNAAGTVHGASGTKINGTQWHAAVWGPNGAQLLGDLAAGGRSVVRGLSPNGVAVGWATKADGSTRAVRWTP